ncbi:MAG TPA: hypothetical protein VG820_05605, partial [Fimbriimonadaceae bacterium]|nr:hypothetical protein [Fimbriimonadaceae bacterium]
IPDGWVTNVPDTSTTPTYATPWEAGSCISALAALSPKSTSGTLALIRKVGDGGGYFLVKPSRPF